MRPNNFNRTTGRSRHQTLVTQRCDTRALVLRRHRYLGIGGKLRAVLHRVISAECSHESIVYISTNNYMQPSYRANRPLSVHTLFDTPCTYFFLPFLTKSSFLFL